MSYFVVIFWGLIAVVLVLAPLALRLFQDNDHLLQTLQDLQQGIAQEARRTEHYRLACDHASDGLLLLDMKGHIIWCNNAFNEMYGTKLENIIGRSPLEFALPPDRAVAPEDYLSTIFGEFLTSQKLQLFQNQRANGDLFWVQVSYSFHRSADGRECAITVCRDVTEQVEQDKELRKVSLRLEHEATHDGLTTVPNRAAFLSFIDEVLHSPEHTSIGLLHIDLDNFKDVNDTHGHSAGDAVLVHCAATLCDAISEGDMVARIGGDEFVVVCPDPSSITALTSFAEHLIALLAAPFEWSGRILQSEASIGAALSACNVTTPDELLLRADFALYEAKRAGRNRATYYDDDMHALRNKQTRYATDIGYAVKRNTLEYYFQPTMNLKTRQVVGMETLVRWNHPQDGLIPPDEFLPIVKNLGLMSTLDLSSMAAALTEKARLDKLGFGHLGIAFNASPELLSHPDFISRLIWGVEAGGIERSQVTIEVLENTNFSVTNDTASHASIIEDLRDAGFHVHLDDFGIGFAGLAHLASIRVSGVKIDRGLISVMQTDPASRKIVRKTIELAIDLGLTVIAEGVEDQLTAEMLETMGCTIIQGHWLSPPLPRAELRDWLKTHRSSINPLRA